ANADSTYDGVHGNTFVDNCANTPIVFSDKSQGYNYDPVTDPPGSWIRNYNGNTNPDTNAFSIKDLGFSTSASPEWLWGFPDPPGNPDASLTSPDLLRPGESNKHSFYSVLSFKPVCK